MKMQDKLNKIAMQVGKTQCKKADYYEVLKLLVENLTDDQMVNDRAKVANLFRKFSAKAADTKNKATWTMRAMENWAETSGRYALMYVHVENGQMVCTDTHRIHISDTDLDDGTYDKKLKPVKEPTGNYPKYSGIVMDAQNLGEEHTVESVAALPIRVCDTGETFQERVELPCGVMLNRQYLLDAIGRDKSFTYRTKEGGESAVCIKVAHGMAVISPVVGMD